ncbi:hypothetical protein [Endozoicomonas lisbonensis]|uniref:Peptidase S74 domain-containing protein n=1 Tax=Endozoicomonas lisbonensis TaxID=3120522 RepID=A0ABV2SP75_9GAMM
MSLVQNWPQQPENDLRVDTAWRENLSGATINRKFNRVIPAGVYQGFHVWPSDKGGFQVEVGGINEDSVAVIDCGGFSLNSRMPEGVRKSITLTPGKAQFVVLEVDYRLKEVTMVTIKAVDEVKLRDGHCPLAVVDIPSDATAVTPEMINNIDPVPLISTPVFASLETTVIELITREVEMIKRVDELERRLDDLTSNKGAIAALPELAQPEKLI